MTFSHLLVFNIPLYLLGFLIIGGTIAFSTIGLLVVRRAVHHSRLKPHHDVADPILGALAAVYAILLAFVVVTVWEHYDRTRLNVETEANYLADLYRDVEAFTPDFRSKINPLLRAYRTAVIESEWKTIAKGEMSPEVEKIVREIWTTYTLYQPKTVTEQTFFAESVSKLNSFRELRRQRIMDSRTGIPSLLWLVLIIEGIIAVSFTFLFGAENFTAQIIMASLLAITISLILFTILAFDFPFTGGISISPEPFTRLLLD